MDANRDRFRFRVAVGVFALWVAVLIGLAVSSSRRPEHKGRAAGDVPATVPTEP